MKRNKKKSKKGEIGLLCPCCNKEKTSKLQYSTFLGQIKTLNKSYAEDNPEDSYYFAGAKQYDGSWLSIMWACNSCINSSKAFVSKRFNAKPQGYTAPVFAFFDLHRNCSRCSSNFIFKKEEWRHWIDELGFFYRTIKKYCDKCQSYQLNNKRLNKLIEKHQVMDVNKLYVETAIKIKDTYLKMGMSNKAKGYLKKILNELPNSEHQNIKLTLKKAYNNIHYDHVG